MNAIETLVSVLCDPEGKCCISGSDDDRRLIDSALADLAQAAQADRIAELEAALFAYASEFEPNSDGDPDVGSIHKNIRAMKAKLASIGAGGVQALSAAPAGFVPVAAFDRLHAHAESLAARLLAASPTPPAEQQAAPKAAPSEGGDETDWYHGITEKHFDRAVQKAIQRDRASRAAAPKAAPGVGNSGFDHKTAADFLNGKTVSDEAVRKFVAAARWAHDERAALSATLLAMRGVLTSREAEIALLKKALLEAEAAPQQEAQEPVMIYHGRCTIDCGEHGHHDMEMLRMIPSGSKLYTAPQPAPAPLSDAQIAEMMRDTWGCASIAPRHALEFARTVERAHGIAQKGGSNAE